ncbi:MAG: GNAT family N-acetyltransferase [Euryarchaeota archaeon]|nr:GNAT family N-acetyltransferase [Euryarchaeota archaeon]
MIFEKMDLERHDPYKVAELIYAADVDTFNFFFKNKASAVEKIEKLVESGNNSLGHEKIYVVSNEGGNHILGILISCEGGRVNRWQELKLIFKIFNIQDTFKLILLDLIDGLFLSDLGPDDYYLVVIAVDEDFRGRGIGTLILNNGLELAKEKGFKRVVLDVDLDNEGAKKLYERFGFRVFGEKSYPWIRGRVGAFNMEYLVRS